jgi:scyllo-inositol 2-dehydrogenase (NADP+)
MAASEPGRRTLPPHLLTRFWAETYPIWRACQLSWTHYGRSEPEAHILGPVASLRAAIIGYGLAGRFFHAPLIAATEGLVLSTVVTSSPERQAQVSREHPGAQVLGSPTELWAAASDHDLVVIATPNRAHAPLAGKAIDHRLPVVVDKPLAMTSGEAAELISHAERASTLLTVFQNRRWDSDQLTLARLLAEDRLGTVVRYESRFERWRPSASAEAWRDTSSPELGGGQLLDLGSHLVDQALVLFGPVTHVYGEVEAVRGAAGDDDAFLALRHAQGAISHLRASAVTAAPGPRLRVLGTKAAFVVRDVDGQEDALRAGARPDQGPEWGSEPEAHWGQLVAGEDSVPLPSERGDWPRFYALLVRALRDGGPPPVDPHDAVAALGVIEAARLSAASRQVVALSG